MNKTSNLAAGAALAALLIGSATNGSGKDSFMQALPVWPQGQEKEQNLLVGFRAFFDAAPGDTAVLRLTAASLYRVYVNGEFAGHGPARAGHGGARVDELPLSASLKKGTNAVAIEVLAANVDNYYLPNQRPFLQAELQVGGRVVAATGTKGDTAFSASLLTCRLQHTDRASFQRTFSEAYWLGPDWDRWRVDASAAFPTAQLAQAETPRLLPRRVPYPFFASVQPRTVVSMCSVEKVCQASDLWSSHGPRAEALASLEAAARLKYSVSPVLKELKTSRKTPVDKPYEPAQPMELGDNGCAIMDFSRNVTGFVGADVSCTSPTRLLFMFDELMNDGDVNPLRLGLVNAFMVELEPGEYRFESIEPYTLRYLKLASAAGGCAVRNVHVREYANDDAWASAFACSDNQLNRVFEAGRETFRQNSPDVFMDCPSRERAGWLCDSFFTARAAQDLCTTASVEKNFIENFLIPAKFEHLPDGMLPMCYPADHPNGNFIPNWALWFVVQLEDYALRTGDRELTDALQSRVMKLFEYFKRFHNSDGLLEKLERWVFVEWSKANDFVQDVNYPSNMLYAGALAAAGRLYKNGALLEQSEKVRATILRQSFDGEFFVDNAMREGGALKPTRNRTETCQYYAFFFGLAAPSTHAALWERMRNQFGLARSEEMKKLEIHPSNAFIGHVLRMDLLKRFGHSQQLAHEIAGFHLKMAERTGTLWENADPVSSCNHGFASYVCYLLYHDTLGIAKLDTTGKSVHLRLPATDLEWCEGRVRAGSGFVSVHWWKEKGQIRLQYSVPAGYSCTVENASGLPME